jgi:hypothetical protein
MLLESNAELAYSQPPIWVLAVFFLPRQSLCVLQEAETSSITRHSEPATIFTMYLFAFIFI